MSKLVLLLLFNVLQGTILLLSKHSRNKHGVVIYISAKETVVTPTIRIVGGELILWKIYLAK